MNGSIDMPYLMVLWVAEESRNWKIFLRIHPLQTHSSGTDDYFSNAVVLIIFVLFFGIVLRHLFIGRKVNSYAEIIILHFNGNG